MAFDWKEYLDLARFLQRGGKNYTQEAACRSAVSRAYYAAFRHARNYARDRHGFRPTYKAEDHKLVRRHFQRRRMGNIVHSLDDLRGWRNNCDYDDTLPKAPLLLVMSAIPRAEQVFSKLA